MTRSMTRRSAGLLATLLLPAALVGLPATTLAAPPANDAYANPAKVGPLPATIDATTEGATEEAGEKSDVCVTSTIGPSIWYKLTPTFTGAISVDTFGSGTDTAVSIYRGTTLAGQKLLGCSGDVTTGNIDARANALVTAGTPVRIRVSSEVEGAVTIHVTRITPPANDSSATPRTIAAIPATVQVSNTTATFAAGEPLAGPCPEVRATRWYALTPTATKALRADTWGATFDTIVSVYRQTSTGLKAVACNDDADDPSASSPGPQAAVTWVARKGVRYLIQVGGYRAQTGAIPLRIKAVARPANDDFATATVIDPTAGLDTHLEGSLVNATPQAGERGSCDVDGALDASVWYRWTAPSDVTMTLTDVTSGGAVYTGSNLGSLTEVVCVDGSTVQWSAVSGTTYRIRIFGTSGYTFPFDVHMVQQ